MFFFLNVVGFLPRRNNRGRLVGCVRTTASGCEREHGTARCGAARPYPNAVAVGNRRVRPRCRPCTRRNIAQTRVFFVPSSLSLQAPHIARLKKAASRIARRLKEEEEAEEEEEQTAARRPSSASTSSGGAPTATHHAAMYHLKQMQHLMRSGAIDGPHSTNGFAEL